jgi:hypothetical protein
MPKAVSPSFVDSYPIFLKFCVSMQLLVLITNMLKILDKKKCLLIFLQHLFSSSGTGLGTNRLTSAMTGYDRLTPATTGSHRLRPAHTGYDRLTPATTDFTNFLYLLF